VFNTDISLFNITAPLIIYHSVMILPQKKNNVKTNHNVHAAAKKHEFASYDDELVYKADGTYQQLRL